VKVALDTNILVQDFWFDSPHSRVFLEELVIIPATLHIPEIVIDETVNKYKEFLTEKVTEQGKLNSDITRLLKKGIENIPINIDQATKNYEKFLTDKLKEVNAQILPYPKVEHKEVVKRIFERHRPFKKGDAGYRDFLIWQTIKKLETWGTEEIVFITNNTRDFGEGGYLSDEFTDKTTGNKNFKISVAVSKFNDEYILPRLKKLDELKLQLVKGQVKNFDFKHWLDNEFSEFIAEVDFEEVLTGFPYGVGRVKAAEILFFDDYKIRDVSQLNSGEKLVHFSVKCKINAHIDISWDDYINHQEVREYYGEGEEEFSFSSGMTSGKINVEGYLILDKQNEEVTEFEITLLDGPGGSIEMGT
jgi:predicted nucleic acid-binding protein